MSMQRTLSLAVLTLAGAAFAGRAGAAEADKYLPDDANLVISFDFRGFLDSPVVKKNAPELVARYGIQFYDAMADADPEFKKSFKDKRDLVKSMLSDRDATAKMLKDWGEAVGTVVVAGNTDEEEPGLFLVRGNFDAAGLKKAIEGTSLFSGKPFKTDALGRRTVYQLNGLGTEKDTVYYAALLEDGVCAVAPKRDAIVEAAAKADGKRETKLSKRMLSALDKVDGKQTLWMCAVSPNEGEDVQSFSAGVTFGKDIQMDLVAQARNAAAARTQAAEMNKGLDEAKDALAHVAESFELLKPLSDDLKPVQATAVDSTIAAHLTITQTTIDKMIKPKP